MRRLAAADVAAHVIRADGVMDEAGWAQAERLPALMQVEPLNGDPIPAELAVEARLLSTAEGIALGVRALHPESIPRRRERNERDARLPVDRVNFMIDFDADGGGAYAFMITLAGSITDETITDETRFNSDWDGDWGHGVSEDEDGFTVEFLIPWSIAPMKDSGAERRTIAIYVDRVVGATGERYAYPYASFMQPRFVADFAPIEIDQHQKALLAIKPYVVALSDLVADERDFKTGLDLFWKPNGDHQLAATINPDFGQVESDELVVNFSAFETFFSDKRPFFTENQSYFDVALPGQDRLLYTRRVGGSRDDGPGAAEIELALKANGTLGDLGYGVFGASEDGEDGRQFLAARFTHALGPGTLGFLATDVDRPALDRRAGVQAFDYNFRIGERWSGLAQFLRSDIDLQTRSLTDTGASLRLDFQVDERWRHQWFLTHYGKDLDLNDFGFLARPSFNRFEWELGYRQDNLPDEQPFLSHNWELELSALRNDTGQNLRNAIALSRYSRTRDGGDLYAEIEYDASGIDDRILRGNGLLNVPGYANFFIEGNRARQGNLSWSWYAYANNEGFDARNYGFSIGPTLYHGDDLNWQLRLAPERQDGWLLWRGGRRIASFDSHWLVLTSNLNWFPAPRHELRMKLEAIAVSAETKRAWFVQPDGSRRVDPAGDPDFTLRNLGFQIRYRYELAPLSDLFVVYSRGGFALDRGEALDLGEAFDTALDLRDADQFLVKLAYRFD